MTDNTPTMKKCRKNNILNVFLWLVLLTLSVSSCIKDPTVQPGWEDEKYDADEVSMSVALSVAPMKSVDSETRAITYVPASDEEKIIADIWIIEYNEEGVRVGLPRYYEIGNTVTDGCVDPIIKDLKILVPREDDHEYTVVVLANTHDGDLFNADNRAEFSTLDALRRYDLDIHNQEDLFDPNPEDNHILKYLLMSGWAKIDKDTEEFTVNLIRNTCKVNVKLTSFRDDLLAIKYIQWVNMPLGKLFPHGTVDHYVEPVSRDWRMHNEESYYEELLSDDGLTFWIPCNVWLPEDGMLDTSRSTRASVSGSGDNDIEEEPTHFDIVCRNNDEDDDINLYEFRIYPSRDGDTQFNFEPNHFYYIEVDIEGLPAEENAFFQIKKFKNLGISNSYMLKQDTKGTYIIGFDRPNTFWDHFGQENLIQDGTEWVAEVIWQDTDQRVVDFAIYSIGEVTPDRSRFFGQGDTCIPFRTTGTGLGNVVIGVRSIFEDEYELTKVELDEIHPIESREYLWSWHLWITDYQPDMINELSTSGVNGFYNVPGGQVIQMGINRMMDRNLGALAPEVNNPSNPEDILNTFGLYYQYGRKDPFPYFNPERRPVYDIDGNLIPAFNEQEVSFYVTTRVLIVDENGRDEKDENGNSVYDYITDNRKEKITMRSSAVEGDDYGDGSFTRGVMRPYMFWADVFNTSHWANDATSVELAGGWYLTAWYQKIMDHTMKDIFDPCPPGWVMDSATGDFYEGTSGAVGSAIELFYGQDQYNLWKGTINSDDSDQSVKFEDTKENWAKIKEYHKLENEFWEDLNDQSVSTSGAPSPFMGCYLYYTNKPGTSYFPAAGSRNRYGAGDRFHNYMCLPWGNIMMRLTSFGWSLINDPEEKKKFYEEEFSTATAMQVRCVKL